jgi:hypothetical protein
LGFGDGVELYGELKDCRRPADQTDRKSQHSVRGSEVMKGSARSQSAATGACAGPSGKDRMASTSTVPMPYKRIVPEIHEQSQSRRGRVLCGLLRRLRSRLRDDRRAPALPAGESPDTGKLPKNGEFIAASPPGKAEG